jgi:hypothetical protein
MNSVYKINKGINRPIEFRGLKAQYIWYLGGSMLLLLILFAVLYVCGINMYVCLAIILTLGIGAVMGVYHLSNTYGEHGLAKQIARRNIPSCLRAKTRSFIINLNRSAL